MIEETSMVSMFRLSYAFPLYEKYAIDVKERVHVLWYPLFFRSTPGAIYFPRRGAGWYMREEAIAAIKWLVHFVPVGKWNAYNKAMGNEARCLFSDRRSMDLRAHE